MAIFTTAERTNIEKLVIAMFNAPPGSTYLNEIVSLYQANGSSLSALAQALSNTNAYKTLNPISQVATEFAAKFLTPYGLQSNAMAVDFIVSKFNAGVNKGQIALEAATAISNYTGTDASILTAQAIQNSKARLADYYSVEKEVPQTSLVLLQAVFAGVNGTPASEAAAKAAIDLSLAAPPVQTSFSLTTGFDSLFGSAAADSFTSNVVQNSLGQQVNTLGSGDTLNGGGGIDSLKATINGGVFAGNTSTNLGAPIQPTTTSIETVKIEAVNSNILDAARNTTVFLNAKDMAGLTSIGSSRSDANLVIQNLTTKDNLGGNTRSLSDITVTMEYTGNSDTRWAESDQAVYFDQDYIVTSSQTNFTKASVDIRLMNEDKYDEDFSRGLRGDQIQALAGVFINKLVITVNNEVFNLGALINETPSNPPDARTDFIKTYPELVAAVQAAVAQLKLNNPTNLALQSLVARTGIQFQSDISPVDGVGRREGTAVLFEMDGSTNGNVNTIVVKAQDLVITPIIFTPIPNSNRYERAVDSPAVPSTQELPLKINLEKVGLAGDGGELLVGSMFKDGTNTYTDLYAGKGISKFEVTVSGASDKPSSLSGLHSTGNNLREVVVKTNPAQAGTSFSSLTIGNSQTDTGTLDTLRVNDGVGLGKFVPVANGLLGSDVYAPTAENRFALKDVQTFDASGLKGKLTLFAALTEEVTAKYMNLKDSPAAAAADNVKFVYTGGSADDYINLHLSSANLAAAGTTTREDFVLTINGGAGDDEIITRIGDGSSGTASTPDAPAVTVVVSAPAAGGQGVTAVREVQTFDFTAVTVPVGGTLTFTVDGLPFVYTNNTTIPLSGATLANNIAAGTNLVITNYVDSANAGSPILTITQNVGSEKDIVGITAANSGGGTTTGVESTKGVTGVAEVFSAVFAGDENGANTTVTFDGVTVTLADSVGASATAIANAIRTDFIAKYNAANGAVTTFVATVGTATGEVVFTSKATGARTDIVTSNFSVVDPVSSTTDNWYVNSQINANAIANPPVHMTINGGLGDDTIRTIGAGDFKINGNEGNDTIYADNSGNKAVYVFNVADGDSARAGNQYDIGNLRSQDAASVLAVNANLTVTFRDIVKTVVIANSANSLVNVAITDLAVNQAIKEAINKDLVLSKLLVAVDGPGNSLVVRSLIDGLDVRPADLSIAFGNTGVLSTAQVAAGIPVTLFAPLASTAVTDGYVTTNFAQNGAGSDTVAFVAAVAPTPAATETATMTTVVGNADMVAGQTYTIAGLTYTSTALTTQAQLSAAFANLLNGATTGAGTATGTYSGSLTGYSTGAVGGTAPNNVVTFTSSTAGTNVTDLTDSGSSPDAAAAAAAVISTAVNGSPTTTEVAVMTGASSLAAGSTYTIAGLSFTAGNLGATQGQLLAAFASLANGATTGVGTAFGTYSGTLTGYSTSTAASNAVTFTPTAVGDKVPNLDDSGSTRTNDSLAALVAVTAQGQAASAGVAGVTASTGTNELTGSNSNSAGDHVITGGTGNDVIVLGTTKAGTLLAASNDTVRYEAGQFGNDTVVNFGANTIIDTGTTGVREVFSATFAGDENGGDTTIAFDGVTVTLADTVAGLPAVTATALAADYVAKYNAVPAATFTAVQTAGTGTVTFTSKLVGDRPDVNAFIVTPVTADAVPVTVTPAAPSTQGAAAVAPVIDADLFDFVLLGGDITPTFTNFNSFVLDKSIVVAAGISNTAAVAAAFTDSLTAATHVYVGYGADNIANVYSVTDAAGVGGVNAVLVGTIDLADTPWATLTAANFV